MVCNEINEKMTKLERNEKYLHMAFTALKKCGHLELTPKTTHFNNTEMRLITEILDAKYKGERLISTQLAKKLGVTRSAISQIVNHLEEQGVVKRVADDVDRKIAYIEATDKMLEEYNADIAICTEFMGKLVRDFGEDDFYKMCELLNNFMMKMEMEKQKLTEEKK